MKKLLSVLLAAIMIAATVTCIVPLASAADATPIVYIRGEL